MISADDHFMMLLSLESFLSPQTFPLIVEQIVLQEQE